MYTHDFLWTRKILRKLRVTFCIPNHFTVLNALTPLTKNRSPITRQNQRLDRPGHDRVQKPGFISQIGRAIWLIAHPKDEHYWKL